MPSATRAFRVALPLILALTVCPAPGIAQLGGARGGPPEPNAAELVLVLVDGTPKQYHRAGCDLVRDGKGVTAMTRAKAESRGYTAHRDCDPSLAPADAAPPADGRGVSVAPQPNVVIDAAGKYYHRENCPRIGASPHKVALKDAGKRWPCPSCKPPVRKPVEAPLVPRWKG